MSWRPMSGRDPAFYLVPIVAPGVLASVWPAFDRLLETVCWWVVVAGIVGVPAYLAWAFFGPRPHQAPRELTAEEWREMERTGRG